MECPRPRLSGTASWLRSTAPTPWHCRSPGSTAPARPVSTRPELIRSWVTDAAGIGDVEFEWHDFAKIWQTQQAGEDFWDQQLAAPAEERAGVFQMFGVP